MKQTATLLAIILLAFFSGCKKTEQDVVTTTDKPTEHAKPLKIVSLNGSITEIISALGYEKDIAGVDVTSTYPETVKKTAKDLGHVRTISVESVIALQPDLIFATEKDLSPDLQQKLKASGVQVNVLKQEFTPEGTKRLIQDVAKVLHNDNFKPLQDKIDNDLKAIKPIADNPKVLFIYARGAGTLMVSGKNTPVDKVISLAGAQNAITEFEDFKPLTPEALIKGNPDVILMFDSGLASLGGVPGILKIQGVEKTNAGKNKKIVTMDGGLLSGFGPRVGEAAAELSNLIKDAK